MADLKETPVWGGVRQIETSDPVLGGENGVSNTAPRQLANRDLYLKTNLEALTQTVTGLSSGKANKATTLLGYGITDAYTIGQANALIGDKIPYMGANQAINLNGQELSNIGQIGIGDGANNQYQSLMFGNYKKLVENENYGVIHNARYVTNTLRRYSTISTFNAVGEHISSLFASDKDAILRIGETNYGLALKNEVANKSIEIKASTGLTGGGDLTANRTLGIDKASIQNVNNADANKVVTADILFPFLAARVSDSRTITTGTGLTGGGDLTANRTLGIDKATIQNVNLGDANKVVTSDVLLPFLQVRVADSRTIATSTGLTGGGDLTANRTLAVDKATLADVTAGTVNKVVCADILQQALANSKNENGYTKLPNGMVLQWGKALVAGSNNNIDTIAVTFPIAYPSICMNIQLNKIDGGGGDVWNVMSSPAPSKTGFSFGVSDKSPSSATSNPVTAGHMFWFAIGY